MRGRRAVAAILEDNNGVLRIAEHGSLRSTVWRMVREGALVREFPGVYVSAARAGGAMQWLAALCAWQPDAVISGEVALGIAAGRIPSRAADLPRLVMHRSRPTRNTRRVWFRCRANSPDDIVLTKGLRLHVPAGAAVEAAATDSGDAIDRLLREHHLDPAALLPHLSAHHRCPGNKSRKRVVLASLTRPFSAAERVLHRLLDRSGITDWVANPRLRIGSQTVSPDAYFPDTALIIEVDGQAFHGPQAFETDRDRQNLLVSNGYTVLRFAWTMLTNRPDAVIATIRRTLGLLRTR